MRAKKCPLLLSKKRAWKRLLVLGPSTAHTRQQNYCPRPYIERRHPLSWLNWYVYEVLIRVHQSSQGCPKLIFSFIPQSSQVNVPTGDQPFAHHKEIFSSILKINILSNIIDGHIIGVTAFIFFIAYTQYFCKSIFFFLESLNIDYYFKIF